jgi:F0F1-type ATP synthase epsilon subunit
MSPPKLTYKTCGDNLEKNKQEAKSLINSIFKDENNLKKQHSIKKNIIQIQVKQTNL